MARSVLAEALPRRWEHVQGVAGKAERVSAEIALDGEVLVSAAWLHDIGYAPAVLGTGFHPLDGARYLAGLGAPERVVNLVARHSNAILEAELRGLGDLLDLEVGTLDIGPTRVVVDGRVIESDGKTENAQHVLALDPFTIAVLAVHVEMLDRERAEFGPDHRDLGLLFCWENGLPPHPDTITRRFKKISADAGLPDIDLHDVRRSYLTAGRKARIDWKALSQRVGHSDVAFTMRQYVETDLEADREVADTLAELIIGGTFSSDLAAGPGPDGEDQGDEDPAA